MALRAVIFDYGMVLSTTQEPRAYANLQKITGLGNPEFDTHYWRYRHQYDLGELSGESYWTKIGEDAELNLTSADIHHLIANDVLMWATLWMGCGRN